MSGWIVMTVLLVGCLFAPAVQAQDTAKGDRYAKLMPLRPSYDSRYGFAGKNLVVCAEGPDSATVARKCAQMRRNGTRKGSRGLSNACDEQNITPVMGLGYDSLSSWASVHAWSHHPDPKTPSLRDRMKQSGRKIGCKLLPSTFHSASLMPQEALARIPRKDRRWMASLPGYEQDEVMRSGLTPNDHLGLLLVLDGPSRYWHAIYGSYAEDDGSNYGHRLRHRVLDTQDGTMSAGKELMDIGRVVPAGVRQVSQWDEWRWLRAEGFQLYDVGRGIRVLHWYTNFLSNSTDRHFGNDPRPFQWLAVFVPGKPQPIIREFEWRPKFPNIDFFDVDGDGFHETLMLPDQTDYSTMDVPVERWRVDAPYRNMVWCDSTYIGAGRPCGQGNGP
jgi:hypothetical protein